GRGQEGARSTADCTRAGSLSASISGSAKLADVLMHHVLKKSIIRNADERVLTRADLYAAIDLATCLSVPRARVDSILSSALSHIQGKARRDRRLALALMAGDDLPGRRNAGLAASFGECIPEPLAVIAAIGEKCLPEASC